MTAAVASYCQPSPAKPRTCCRRRAAPEVAAPLWAGTAAGREGLRAACARPCAPAGRAPAPSPAGPAAPAAAPVVLRLAAGLAAPSGPAPALCSLAATPAATRGPWLQRLLPPARCDHRLLLAGAGLEAAALAAVSRGLLASSLPRLLSPPSSRPPPPLLLLPLVSGRGRVSRLCRFARLARHERRRPSKLASGSSLVHCWQKRSHLPAPSGTLSALAWLSALIGKRGTCALGGQSTWRMPSVAAGLVHGRGCPCCRGNPALQPHRLSLQVSAVYTCGSAIMQAAAGKRQHPGRGGGCSSDSVRCSMRHARPSSARAAACGCCCRRGCQAAVLAALTLCEAAWWAC
jgi:hypothetical protein